MNILSGSTWTSSENEVLKTYYATTEVVNLQKILPGRTKRAIYLQAFKLGLKRACRSPWTEAENAIIRDHYPKLGYEKLRVMLPRRTGKSIACQAANLGIKVQNDYVRRLSLGDLDFFCFPNVLNSYWAGFIAADGCITDGNKIQIALAALDKSHLERFCSDIGYPRSLQIMPNNSEGSRMVRFDLRSSTMVRNLEQNYGIKPRKTFDLNFPAHLNFENQAAFIAGLIDGDGCIQLFNSRSSQIGCYLNIKIVGTKNALNGIKKFADIYSPINKSVSAKPSSVVPYSSIYAYRLSGYRALAFAELIMHICKGIPLLMRKWDCVINYRRLITDSGIQRSCLAAIPTEVASR